MRVDGCIIQSLVGPMPYLRGVAGSGYGWMRTEWVWTDRGIYPFLFSHDPHSWLYFYGRSKGKVLFYRYSDNLWITKQLEVTVP